MKHVGTVLRLAGMLLIPVGPTSAKDKVTHSPLQIHIEPDHREIVTYQPVHLCVWITNTTDKPITISFTAGPSISYKRESNGWEDVRSPSQMPVPTPPRPRTRSLLPGSTFFFPRLAHFTTRLLSVGQEEGESDRAFQFRERYRPVFDEPGKWWLRAEWRFSEKANDDANKGPTFSIVSDPVAVTVVEGDDTDRRAVDTLKKTPEIFQYFSDLAPVRIPLSDVALQNAQSVLAKHADSIFAGYCRFAIATHERLVGKSDWKLRAEQQYKAVRDGKDQRPKAAALLRLAELAAPDNPSLALHYCEQLQGDKPDCYVRAQALALRERLSRSTSARTHKDKPVLAQPIDQLDKRVSFSGGKITVRDVLAFLQQESKASVVDAAESEYMRDGNESGLIMFCSDMPVAYLLSWFEQCFDLQYDLTDDKGQVDNNGRKTLRVLFEEKHGPWRNAMNAALQKRATCGFTESDLPSAIRILAETAKVSFIIDPEVLGQGNTVPKVSGRYTNEKLSSILDDLLKPTEITYQLQGHAVYIFSK